MISNFAKKKKTQKTDARYDAKVETDAELDAPGARCRMCELVMYVEDSEGRRRVAGCDGWRSDNRMVERLDITWSK